METDNDCDKDAKTTSITWERQAATVPQVPLYFFGQRIKGDVGRRAWRVCAVVGPYG